MVLRDPSTLSDGSGTEREESSTRPGARRLSFSLSLGDAEGDEVRDVGPTIRSERSGFWLLREAWRRASAMDSRADATGRFFG